MPVTTPLKIAVYGATGRTGSRVASLAEADPRFRVVARPGRGGLALDGAAVAIDFTTPEACVRLAAACARSGAALVTGTTGLSPAQRARLAAAGRRVPVVAASNFSRGVALLNRLAELAASRLPGWDAAVVETHHRAKKDAPSGTALTLAAAARAGGAAPVPISSLRLGGVAGDHVLVLAGPSERLELVHRAESRDVFARGALDAALWAARRRPGLYGMADVLGAR